MNGNRLGKTSCIIALVLLSFFVCNFQSFQQHLFKESTRIHSKGFYITNKSRGSKLHSFLSTFLPFLKTDEPPLPDPIDKEYLLDKPWRAPKKRYLTYNYRIWTESWRERFVTPDDLKDNVYYYTLAGFKPINDRFRLEDIWAFPYLWTKIKAERFSWLMKLFYADCEKTTVQEHMEIEAFLSEFDMPTRWRYMRHFEFDGFILGLFNLVVQTDFTGITPTDLGIRPDGTVRTCPVEVYDCISSSNDPSDFNHYAPPLKWSRGKSPEQAYDEVKTAYLKYPKRGLRITSGFIDRGGYTPIDFGGSYFHGLSLSILFNYADDTELIFDPEKREVQYRSGCRFRQYNDWDLQRSRYNQFVKMLEKNGGWESKRIDKMNFWFTTSYRLSQYFLDSSVMKFQEASQTVSELYNEALTGQPSTERGKLTQDILRTIDPLIESSVRTAQRVYVELFDALFPYIQPVITSASDLYDSFRYDPRIASAIQLLNDLQLKIEASIDAIDQIETPDLQEIIDKFYKLLPERLPFETPDDVEIDSSLDENEVNRIVLPTPSKQEEYMKQMNSIQFDKRSNEVTAPIQSYPTERSKKYKEYLQYFQESQSSAIEDSKSIESKAPAVDDSSTSSMSSKPIESPSVSSIMTSQAITNDVEWLLGEMDGDAPQVLKESSPRRKIPMDYAGLITRKLIKTRFS